MMRPPRLTEAGSPERGVALIVVLLVLSLLIVVVGEFALAMRLEGTTTLNFRSAVAAAYLAEAAYHRAATEILPNAIAHHLDERGLLVFRRDRLTAPVVPQREAIALGPGRYSYRITDEEARLNVNGISRQSLDRLLKELGVERADRDVIADSVLDWRDPNEAHLMNGAESEYYLALPAPYRAKNANLDSLEELLQVRGVTSHLFYGRPESPGLAAYLRVAGSATYNVNTASPVVLRTLGFSEAEVELLIAGRPYVDRNAVSAALRRGAQRTRSDYFRIEAWGEVPGQKRQALTAVVQRRPGRDGVLRVTPLAWRWNAEPIAGDSPPPPRAEPTRGEPPRRDLIK